MRKTYGRFSYAQPSFIVGMARIFDVAGALQPRRGSYNPHSAVNRADAHSLRADFEQVARYLHDAIAQFEEEAQVKIETANEPEASRYALLPDPDIIRRYEEIIPGAANRILELAEQKQMEAFAAEKADIANWPVVAVTNTGSSYMGMAVGFASAVFGIIGGTWLIASGYDWLGLTVAVVPLTGLFGISIYAIRKHNRG